MVIINENSRDVIRITKLQKSFLFFLEFITATLVSARS